MMIDLKSILYEHSIRCSYMDIPDTLGSGNSCEAHMLKEVRIPGVLPLTLYRNQTQSYFRLDITGAESMEHHFENRLMRVPDIQDFIFQLDALLESLESYLLTEELILLDPSCIFINPATRSWLFTLIPGNRDDFSSELPRLLSYFLKRIDYQDDLSVILAYNLFQQTTQEHYCMENLKGIIRSVTSRHRASVSPLLSRESSAAIEAPVEPPSSSSPAAVPGAPSVEAPEPLMAAPLPGSISPASPPEDGLIFNRTDDACHQELYQFSSAYAPSENAQTRPSPGTPPSPVPPVISSLSSDENPKATIQTMNETIQKNRALKQHIVLAVLFMILMPALIFVLKGPTFLHKVLPVILVLEIGGMVITALDVLVAKMPDDA